MRFLPVFLDLRRGPVLVIGGGELLRAKLRLLLAAGASIRCYAIDGYRELGGIEPGQGQIAFVDGDPLAAEWTGVIAVFCAGAGDLGAAVAARARAHGIPVNVMDDIDNSSFIMPAIVDRGDVVVAIGTGGASPVVARRLRQQIEALLPSRIGELAGFIGRWRKTIHQRIPQFALRRKFWERVVDGPIGAQVLAGHPNQADNLLENIDNPSDFAGAAQPGHVTLVGAGPGDPDLLTLKALRALQDADTIFYDDLVSQEVLDRARRDATLVSVGRRAGQPGIGQDEINRRLIVAANLGQRCVRLKGGDALLFGRGGEEIAALRDAGISYSVVPGITAALGAAAEFDVPLTFRNEALRVSLLTAHAAKDVAAIDFSALTDEKTTLVVYMGMSAAAQIRAGLLAAGRSPLTPAGVFARVTRPNSKAALGTLDQLLDLVAQVEGGPAILIIGDVVAHAAPWHDTDSNSHPFTPLTQKLSEMLAAAE
ncbi:MAG TPA: siroheme synthase CysG [Rhodopseudomonas sp.]|uniref:siroheme synthase CysG n=1 Tax=Rhodopseudomonas sp. TaxID=1078 RepID=UPI002EDA3D6B